MRSKQAPEQMRDSPVIVVDSEPVPAGASTTYMWAILGLAVVVQMAGSIVAQGIYVLVPVWKADFGISHATAALAVTVVNGIQVFSMIGLGRATDRHGERVVLSLTMIGMGLAAIAAAAFASSYLALLCFIGLIGMFYAAVQPSGTRAILRWFPPQHRGLAVGVRQAAVPLATAIAAFMLPLLAASSGWRTAVLVQGVIGITGGVLFWFAYRADEEVGPAGMKAVQLPQIPFRELIRSLGKDPAFRPIVLAGIAMAAFQASFIAGAIMFMADHFRIGLVLSASLFAAAQLAGIPGRVLLPYLSDRFWPGRRERSLGWTMALCALTIACYGLLPAHAPGWALYGLLGIIGFFGIGWYPLFVLQVAEISPKSAIASTLSFVSTLCIVAMAAGPFIFGFLVDVAGYPAAWIGLGLPVALLVLPLLRLPPRPSP